MFEKRALISSLVVHAIVFALLASGIKFSAFLDDKNPIPIQARLIIKKEKKKDSMPRKPAAPVAKAKEEKIEKVKKAEPPKKEEPLPKVAEKIKSKPKTATDYSKALASLSQTFAQDLADAKPEEAVGEPIIDSNYFDEIYTLIKESFVVPPHINGPQGKNLQTVVKLFLSADGSLLRIELVTPSGDDHFDKAVMDGTQRISNFGLVPITLQGMVRERGIVVELCPFKCKDR